MAWWQIVLILLMFIVVGLVVGSLLSYLIMRLQKRLAGAEPQMAEGGVEQRKSVVSNPFVGLFRRREVSEAERLAKAEAKRQAEEAKKAREAEEQRMKEAERLAKAEAVQAEEARKAEELAKAEAVQAEEARKAEELARAEAVQAEEARKAEELAKAEVVQAEEEVVEPQQVVPAAAPAEQPQAPATGLVTEIENNLMVANEPWTGKLIAFQTQVWDNAGNEVNAVPAKVKEELTQIYSDIRLANSIVWLAMELNRRSPNLDESYTSLCTSIAARLEKIVPTLKGAGS